MHQRRAGIRFKSVSCTDTVLQYIVNVVTLLHVVTVFCLLISRHVAFKGC